MALFKKNNEPGIENVLKGDALYDKIIDALKSQSYSYDEHKDNLFVQTGFRGDDLSITMFIKATDETGIVYFDCPLEFTVNESSKGKLHEAINEINNSINLGAFTIVKDRIWFRYHHAPFAKLQTQDVAFLINLVAKTVDDHDGDLNKLNTQRVAVSNVMYG